MARFARIDWQIRANCLILANRFRVPELNPIFANRASGGLNIANRRFEAIRVNRPQLRCESPVTPGQLKTGETKLCSNWATKRMGLLWQLDAEQMVPPQQPMARRA